MTNLKILSWIFLILISMLAGCNHSEGISPSPAPYGTLLPLTHSPTTLPSEEGITPELVATPYTIIFDGYHNCRAAPSTSSPLLVLIQGQQITINAKNPSSDWLYVKVQYFDKPCWVSTMDISNIDYYALSLIPIYNGAVTPTFTLPADYIPPTFNGGGGNNTSGSTPTPPTPPTLTPITPPTPTFTPSLTPCWKPSAPSLSYRPSNGNNFILSWSAVSGATSYRVHRSGGGSGDTGDTSATVEVKNNQSFTFYVTAINKCGESGSSNSVTISR